jgi:hypothetical protein
MAHIAIYKPRSDKHKPKEKNDEFDSFLQSKAFISWF